MSPFLISPVPSLGLPRHESLNNSIFFLLGITYGKQSNKQWTKWPFFAIFVSHLTYLTERHARDSTFTLSITSEFKSADKSWWSSLKFLLSLCSFLFLLFLLFCFCDLFLDLFFNSNTPRNMSLHWSSFSLRYFNSLFTVFLASSSLVITSYQTI